MQREEVRRAAKKRVQFRELSSLTLVPHPYPFLVIPSARTMEKEKNIVFPLPVFLFSFDFLPVQVADSGSSSCSFLFRVPKIGQQAEVQVLVHDLPGISLPALR
jgi:hypothetical protein